ncbi:MAG: hypothetical protein ACRDP6_08305 [Actinoallomurus sp.]
MFRRKLARSCLILVAVVLSGCGHGSGPESDRTAAAKSAPSSTSVNDGCPALAQSPLPAVVTVLPPGLATLDDAHKPVEPLALPAISAVYCAVTHADYARMDQLYCDRGCGLNRTVRQAQIRLWRRPGMLEKIAAVLRTHGALTDGYTYPGFALAGFQTDYDLADAKALGVQKATLGATNTSYHGLTAVFGNRDTSDIYVWSGVFFS